MREIAVILLALSACSSTVTTGSIGPGSSGGAGGSVGTSGGKGTSAGTLAGTAAGSTGGTTAATSGGQTTGGSDPCLTKPPCPTGMVCDPAKDGACECYLGGPACSPIQICAMDGGCVADPCFGVTCAASGAACYGGECRCGGPNGPVCATPGASCSPIDNSCAQSMSCAVTPCETNEVCNPRDSTCHCGGTDGPACGTSACLLFVVDGGPLAPGEDAGGAQVYGRCSGDPCQGVVCPPLEACDENNNGACECGGAPDQNIPGTVCAADESCVDPVDGGIGFCLPDCQPFGAPCPARMPDGSMPVPQACDYFPASQATVCAKPEGDAGVIYCDVFGDGGSSTPPPDGGTHACAAGDVCTPLPAGIIAGTCGPG